MSDEQIVDYLIELNMFMTLATADANGKPWSCPVGFTYDDERNLYWISAQDALHSKNIAARPQVGVSIFGKVPEGGFDGVYIDGIAAQIDDEAQMQKVIDLFTQKRPQPPRFVAKSPADVSGKAIWRMYKITPLHIYKRQDSQVGGQAVTVRKRIS